MAELAGDPALGRGARFRRQAPGQLRLVEITGPGALDDSAGWMDRVHAETGVSLLSGRRWLQAWVKAFSGWEPWVLTLLADDEPLAVAPLARRVTGWGVEVASMGAEQLQESPVAARDELGAAGLAVSIAHALESLESRWSLRLVQFPVSSPLTPALQEHLEPSRVRAGGGRPTLHLAEDRPPERMLSANTRAAVAKARNRIRREGHRLEVEWLTVWDQVEAALPEVVAIHRARDLELRGSSLLDDPEEADFYQQVLVRHAEHWRLLAARIDGALAGYALCLADGGVLRVWDNRLSPDWRRYSAGLIANAEVVLGAGHDPAIHEVDWGLGIQRYKESMSNELVPAQNVLAWSSSLLRARRGVERRLRSRAWMHRDA